MSAQARHIHFLSGGAEQKLLLQKATLSAACRRTLSQSVNPTHCKVCQDQGSHSPQAALWREAACPLSLTGHKVCGMRRLGSGAACKWRSQTGSPLLRSRSSSRCRARGVGGGDAEGKPVQALPQSLERERTAGANACDAAPGEGRAEGTAPFAPQPESGQRWCLGGLFGGSTAGAVAAPREAPPHPSAEQPLSGGPAMAGRGLCAPPSRPPGCNGWERPFQWGNHVAFQTSSSCTAGLTVPAEVQGRIAP